jgi:hypothetical protein
LCGAPLARRVRVAADRRVAWPLIRPRRERLRFESRLCAVARPRPRSKQASDNASRSSGSSVGAQGRAAARTRAPLKLAMVLASKLDRADALRASHVPLHPPNRLRP